MEENTLHDLAASFMASLNITAETSRSQAKKNKPENLHCCLTCFNRYHDKNKLITHLKEEVHRADRQRIKEEFQAKKILKENNPGHQIHEEHYKFALAQITLLERFGNYIKG